MALQLKEFNRSAKIHRKILSLGVVYQFTTDGWPNRRNRIPRIARRYWDQRDELSIDHGLLMKGSRIIIPTTQRERTLTNLHVGHQGIPLHATNGQNNCILAWDRCRYRRLGTKMFSMPSNETKPEERTTSTTRSPRWTMAEDWSRFL